MSELGTWLETNRLSFNRLRANRTAARIAQKPVSILVARGNAELAEQQVRIETGSGERRVTDEGGTTYSIDAVVLGYKDHPSYADTDLLPGDLFVVTSDEGEPDIGYQVVMLAVETPGCLQAFAKVVG